MVIVPLGGTSLYDSISSRKVKEKSIYDNIICDTLNNGVSNFFDLISVGTRVGVTNTRGLDTIWATSTQILTCYINTQCNHDRVGCYWFQIAMIFKKLFK